MTESSSDDSAWLEFSSQGSENPFHGTVTVENLVEGVARTIELERYTSVNVPGLQASMAWAIALSAPVSDFVRT